MSKLGVFRWNISERDCIVNNNARNSSQKRISFHGTISWIDILLLWFFHECFLRWKFMHYSSCYEQIFNLNSKRKWINRTTFMRNLYWDSFYFLGGLVCSGHCTKNQFAQPPLESTSVMLFVDPGGFLDSIRRSSMPSVECFVSFISCFACAIETKKHFGRKCFSFLWKKPPRKKKQTLSFWSLCLLIMFVLMLLNNFTIGYHLFRGSIHFII